MKAIVHIGTEKTGTSSIQQFLHINRKKLLRHGFHFVRSAGETNNWALPAYCSVERRLDDFYRKHDVETDDDLVGFRQQFEQEFDAEMRSMDRGVHTVVISSEHFHSRLRTAEEMEKLKTFLSKYFDEVKIVCYLREQGATCASWYSTNLKSGGTDSFFQFVRRCSPENYYFNYSKFLQNWESYFGLDALDVRIFEEARFLNGNLLDDFSARLDPALVGELNTNVAVVNESLNPAGQAMARAINMAFSNEGDHSVHDDLRDRLQEMVAVRLPGRGQKMSSAMQKTIYKGFVSSNEAVREKFFPDSACLFLQRAEDEQTGEVIVDELFQVLTDVFKELESAAWNLHAEDYERTWSAVAVSVGDVLAIRQGLARPGTQVVLSEEAGRLLYSAANKVEGRDLDLAEMLVGLALKANPKLPGLRARLKKYDERRNEGRKHSYIITYHGINHATTEEESRRADAVFIKWSMSLDRAIGAPVNPISGQRAKIAGDKSVEVGDSYFRGFTVFRAKSLDEAVAIAQTCPHLDYGGWVEVVQLDDLENHV